MSISIVIVFSQDRKKELTRCLDSIKSSTISPKETLVINNANNPELVEEFEKKYQFVRFIHLPSNTGIFAWNVGFANASGKYILCLDDDCELRPDTLTGIVNTLRDLSHRVGALALNMYHPKDNFYPFGDFKKLHGRNVYVFYAGAVVFRKSIFEKTGYYDEDFFNWFYETDFVVRILNAGYTIQFDKTVSHHYAKVVDDRPKAIFLTFRNIAWFNVKYFSLFFLPFLMLRNLITLVHLPVKLGLILGIYALFGYVVGWLTLFRPLRKRKLAAFSIQKKFLSYYILNKN